MSSLLEIICGVGSRLPVCTRIVMRRACSCEVRWGNGLRCGARAVVRRCFARICWRLSEATRVPSLREIHVVTLFLLTSSPTRRDAVPGHLESDMTGIWACYQNLDPVSLGTRPRGHWHSLRVFCEASGGDAQF